MPPTYFQHHQADLKRAWRKYVWPRLCFGNPEAFRCLRDNFWECPPSEAWEPSTLTKKEAGPRFRGHCDISGIDPLSGESTKSGTALLSEVLDIVALIPTYTTCLSLAQDMGEANAILEYHFSPVIRKAEFPELKCVKEGNAVLWKVFKGYHGKLTAFQKLATARLQDSQIPKLQDVESAASLQYLHLPTVDTPSSPRPVSSVTAFNDMTTAGSLVPSALTMALRNSKEHNASIVPGSLKEQPLEPFPGKIAKTGRENLTCFARTREDFPSLDDYDEVSKQSPVSSKELFSLSETYAKRTEQFPVPSHAFSDTRASTLPGPSALTIQENEVWGPDPWLFAATRKGFLVDDSDLSPVHPSGSGP